VSLLLDALKQAERNKAQGGEQAASAAPAPSDPKIRLDSIDLELREPGVDKVEPYVTDEAARTRKATATASPGSTVTRAMQEPRLRAGGRYAAEQEVEHQQNAKQLFAAKQGARKPRLGGTWIAGIAVAALAVASALIYFWTAKRGETVAAYTAPQPVTVAAPAAGQAVPAAAPAAAPAPSASVVSQGTDAPSADQNSAAMADARAALGEPAPQRSPAEATATATVTAAAAPDPIPTKPPAQPRAGAASAATPDHSDASVDAAQARAAEVAAGDNEEEPVLLAETKQTKKKPRKAQRKAQTNDAWVMQPDTREEGDVAPTASTRHARKQSSGAADSSLSVQRSAPAEELHPDLTAAYQALIAGNAGLAAQRYQAVLKADAFNLDAELGLATIAASQGDRESARRHYRRALELDPKNDVALAGLASLAGASGASSESGLKTQLAEQPTSHHLHFALGNDLARQRRWPEAQQAYFNAYSLDPDNPDYAYNLAVSLDQLNQPRPALSYYERARQLSEARSAQFNRAQLDQRISDLKQP
jgi:tetratricopeptide (TPR) repeat protein